MRGRPESQINVFDLRHLLDVQAKVARALKDAVLFAAEVTVFDESGSYLLGSLFWDPEQDDWQWDPRGYGKDVPPATDASAPGGAA